MEALEAIGHKRLLLLTGEHPKYPFELFLEAVSVVRFSFRQLVGRYRSTCVLWWMDWPTG